jgi:queuine tRNA-ribosyltransferase
MPVGTYAAVKGISPSELTAAGAEIILGGNTYHMLCSPGLDIIEKIGGMHAFMAWQKPMLTDSGGFQVFSLSKKSSVCRIDDDGATFKPPNSEQALRMDAETSIFAQRTLGADIIMAFDYCTPDSSDRDLATHAMEVTHRWLIRSAEAHAASNKQSLYGLRQAFFGIIQGGPFRDLRERSAEFIVATDTDGIAIGGESIGYNMERTREILSWVVPALPPEKLRYTMGVGKAPQDLLDVTAAGADMFDCVAPTRNARHGALYCGHGELVDGWVTWRDDAPGGKINIDKAAFARDTTPIAPSCGCLVCATHSRAYMHYLFKTKAPEYVTWASMHNIAVMENLCRLMRDAVTA